MKDLGERLAQLSPEKRALLAKRLGAAREEPRPEREPIAIVGMSCRYPGGAHGPEGFWQLLEEGRDAITTVPADRFDVDAYYDPRPFTRGKLISRYGGFLDGVDGFDADFFGMAPREANRMDPQQRILLEVAWEALEDAGLPREQIARSEVGVFVGAMGNDYWSLCTDIENLDAYAAAGNALSVLSNRLSYQFDLRGPSLTLDTACSSSLVAVDLARRSLQGGHCDAALAGGVTVILNPETTIALSQGGAFARDGHCKTFDASADGYVRSEGCGVVVLKRLSDARRDGDRILALLSGSAVNQDGRSNGLTAPTARAQAAVIRAALAEAGASPSEISYVEAHGTGTPLGDPIEMEALIDALCEGRSEDDALVVGGVKTNIGHTEGAAGVAGLIKTVLALAHELIPAHLHLGELNPLLVPHQHAFAVPSEARAWPRGARPRRAGVSSFGFGGTNAHVIVEEAPPENAERAAEANDAGHLLVLSAHGAAALRERAESIASFVKTSVEDADLYDLGYTAAVRRTHLDHRLAILFRDRAELLARIDAFVKGSATPGLSVGRYAVRRPPRVAFVYPGHGPDCRALTRELMDVEPVFREALEACDTALRPLLGESLLDSFEGSRARRAMGVVETQTVRFALQVALTRLWRSWGVEPDGVVGHSMGEVTAAWAAGALALEDAARVIVARSRLMEKALSETPEAGAMLSAEVSWDDACELVAGAADRLSIAAHNAPNSVVFSGDSQAVAALRGTLEEREVFHRPLQAPGAGHSPFVDPLRARLCSALAGLAAQRASIPLYSTVDGALRDGDGFDASYWGRNLREPVRFSPALDAMVSDGYDAFVEITPIAVLGASISESLLRHGREGTVLPTQRRGEAERESLLKSLAALYVVGQSATWGAVFPRVGRVLSLPSYPWQRESFWVAEPGRRRREPAALRRRAATSLGEELASPALGETRCWQFELDVRDEPRLGDHRVRGTAVVPAAELLALAASAAASVTGSVGLDIERFEVSRVLVLPDDVTRRLQVLLRPDGPKRWRVEVHASGEEDPAGPDWRLCATAWVAPFTEGEGESTSIPALRAECPDELEGDAHYDALRRNDLHHGPPWQCIRTLSSGNAGRALASLDLPESVAHESERHAVHPALLECITPVAALALGEAGSARGAPLFTGAELIRLRCPARGTLWVQANARSGDPAGPLLDARFFDAEGREVVEIRGLRVTTLARTDEDDASGRLEELLGGEAGSEAIAAARRARDEILAAPAPRRRALLLAFLVNEIARVLEVDPSRIDPTEPLENLAIGSVVAIEMKNRVEVLLGVELPMEDLAGGSHLARVAATMAKQLNGSAPTEPSGVAATRTLNRSRARADRRKDAMERANAARARRAAMEAGP